MSVCVHRVSTLDHYRQYLTKNPEFTLRVFIFYNILFLVT
ncbi:protein of unknown function [Xenorhabdus doucetiae]|uniref:Uncharacterized protein n=1 Tax=Xenorhabdus doucetiae TaxID=351671 RepID=A0A068QSU3_9GAMM|nr:protein of unknown function [Xenorhabdus doucetiae]